MRTSAKTIKLNLQQYILTVTGTNWTTVSAIGVPYKTVDGAWRLKFNISGTISSGASYIALTASGVTVKASITQSISGHAVDGGDIQNNLNKTAARGATNDIYISGLGGTTLDSLETSGDIELESKPDFME